MYPYIHLRLNRKGFERCWELLAAAGMPFTEERRDSFTWLRDSPPITDVFGTLSTPRGPLACRLRDGMGQTFDLRVPLGGDALDVLGDIERILADYLVREPPRKARVGHPADPAEGS